MSAVVEFPARPETRPYLDAFARQSSEPDWLARQRRRALARFAEQGFPSRRSEAWRYLDLHSLERTPMLPAGARRQIDTAAARALLAELGFAEAACRLVLVDGYYRPGLSTLDGLPAGVSLGSMATAIAERPALVRPGLEAEPGDGGGPFAALNAAFFGDGFVLDVAPGVTLDSPVEIVHLASGDTGGSLHTRNLVAVGAGSRITLIETFAGSGSYWRNDVAELRLDSGAELAWISLIEESARAVHLAELSATLGPKAAFDGCVLLLGGRMMRHEARVHAGGGGSRCGLSGAFLASDHQQANIVTTVDHTAPGGETREVFKGVASGHAHGAFQGRITVRPGAQKVDAQMVSRNLLLGRHAAIDTKPELEILADDVKCGHGATVGDLDDAALFYLLARGIPRGAARRMLIEAFLREAVDLVDHPLLRAHLQSRLTRRLATLEEQG